MTIRLGDRGEELAKQHYCRPAPASHPIRDFSSSAFMQFRRSFDSQLGGFGGAPKFPRPSAFNFLLRYYARTGNEEALEWCCSRCARWPRAA